MNSLFDLIEDEPETVEQALTLDERFAQFHAANPHIYGQLVDMARQLVRRGHKHLGVAMLWETLRYSTMLHTAPGEEFKLNNSYRSRYARLIMDQEPDLAGVFEIRTLRTDAA